MDILEILYSSMVRFDVAYIISLIPCCFSKNSSIFFCCSSHIYLTVVIYEPSLSTEVFEDYVVVNNLSTFKAKCDVIVANRTSEDLSDVREKVYTRDLYARD